MRYTYLILGLMLITLSQASQISIVPSWTYSGNTLHIYHSVFNASFGGTTQLSYSQDQTIGLSNLTITNVFLNGSTSSINADGTFSVQAPSNAISDPIQHETVVCVNGEANQIVNNVTIVCPPAVSDSISIIPGMTANSGTLTPLPNVTFTVNVSAIKKEHINYTAEAPFVFTNDSSYVNVTVKATNTLLNERVNLTFGQILNLSTVNVIFYSPQFTANDITENDLQTYYNTNIGPYCDSWENFTTNNGTSKAHFCVGSTHSQLTWADLCVQTQLILAANQTGNIQQETELGCFTQYGNDANANYTGLRNQMFGVNGTAENPKPGSRIALANVDNQTVANQKAGDTGLTIATTLVEQIGAIIFVIVAIGYVVFWRIRRRHESMLQRGTPGQYRGRENRPGGRKKSEDEE